MSRIEPLAVSEWPAAMRDAVRAPGASRSPASRTGPWGHDVLGVFAHHPAATARGADAPTWNELKSAMLRAVDVDLDDDLRDPVTLPHGMGAPAQPTDE